MKEVLIKDPKGYRTFNEFFYRKLKPGARPTASPQDGSIVTSVADCRLLVAKDVNSARQFWYASTADIVRRTFHLIFILGLRGSNLLSRRFLDRHSSHCNSVVIHHWQYSALPRKIIIAIIALWTEQ